jgi:ABC-type amino acid transport substrate-binding protein
MRWLLLINLLAVVLLSGAVAIVLEGTPVGEGASNSPDTAPVEKGENSEQVISDDQARVPEPDASRQLADLSGKEIAQLPQPISEAEEVLDAAPSVPVPLPAPRKTEAKAPELSAAVEDIVPVVPLLATLDPLVPSASEAPLPLRVATEGDFAPFNYLNEKGEPSGFDVDVARELCRRLNRPCTFETKKWADLAPALQQGEVDMIAASMRIPSARPAGLVFSDPYYGSRGRFVAARGTAIAGIGSLQASGAQIAVQQGSLHAAYLARHHGGAEIVPAQSLAAALKLVADGKVEAAFGDNAAILRWIKDTNCCAALGPALSDADFFGDGIGLVLRDDNPELKDALNRHLQEMVADGTNASLSERYFGGSIY